MVSLAVAFTGLELLFRFTGAEKRLFPMVVVSDDDMEAYALSDDFPDVSTMIVNPASSTVTYAYPDDPRGYFGNRNTVENRYNSLGFRGPEFERKKGKGAFRLAFLGDSFTLGQGVKFEDTYPQVVSSGLNQRYAGTGVRFESYDFGVAGGNLINALNVFVTSGVGSRPDMVILGLTLNDMEPNIVVHKNIGGKLVAGRRPRDLDWFEGARTASGAGAEGGLATVRVLSRAWTSIRMSAKTVDYYRALYGQGNSEWRAMNLQALESIAERCSKRKIPFRVLILPVFYRFDAYPFEEIHRFLRGFLEDRRIDYVDLLDSFRGMRHGDLWVHRVDPHPNEKAHAVIARVALDKVIEPALPSRRSAP